MAGREEGNTCNHLFEYLSPSLVPWPVRAIRVTRGGLEPRAMTSLSGDVTSEIAEDDWGRGCLSPPSTPPTSRKPFLVAKDKEIKKKRERNVEMWKCAV